jgi:uncharacterized membrane protein YgcG
MGPGELGQLMKQVVYVGTSDFRELGAADFEKLGVDHDDMVFPRGQAVEVSNALAEKLMESPLVRRQFVEYDEDSALVQRVAADAASPSGGNLMVPVDDETGELKTAQGPAEDAQTDSGSAGGTASGGSTSGGSTAGSTTSSGRGGSTARTSGSRTGRSR